jgi:hypothetical protein
MVETGETTLTIIKRVVCARACFLNTLTDYRTPIECGIHDSTHEYYGIGTCLRYELEQRTG